VDVSEANNIVSIAASLAGGILLGGIVGYAAHATFSEPEVVVPPPEIIEKEISDEDLARLCETLTEDEKTKVVQAQERVLSLQDELASKEAALAEYKAKRSQTTSDARLPRRSGGRWSPSWRPSASSSWWLKRNAMSCGSS